ncbi:resolvase [Bifidobacterium animalis subsp. lactis]|uniref:recombinase family protein n=1 Tax=Bifidobacterium animalis TaxID=28025 RepID=UPI001021377F|nr:recombinase family protein [Bifidobacterium animalis]RYM94929.1 resolvase [Bifidobacterium animalis subsp. lactis]RYM95005.1 resolvase [Bifidobacterium animalis subsp. lactis]
MPSRTFGYARMSTSEQNTNLQRDGLIEAGCGRIFEGAASGARVHRPELDRMIGMLREGDAVVVWKLDRFGRSYAIILAQ